MKTGVGSRSREALTTDLEGQATQLSVPFGRVTILVLGPGDTTGNTTGDGPANGRQITRQIDFTEAQSGPLELQLPSRSSR